jgi:hypothetical protein
MSNFTKRIVTETGVLEFNFDRVSTTGNTKYHVSVSANSHNYHFTMEAKSGRWKIVSAPLPPQWILGFEEQLATEILRHLAA